MHTRRRASVCGLAGLPEVGARLAAAALQQFAAEGATQPQRTDADAAPWMKTAFAEIGVAERRGMHNANPRILEYFKASHFWGKDDSSAKNAWCGSFVAWVMQKNNLMPVPKAFRAKEWINFGRKIDHPVYGAIGIKSRKGGGHVAFIVGQSEDGEHYYMLGGNQDDQVKISRYPRSVWTTFVVPLAYDAEGRDLPVYRDDAAAAGRES